MYEPTSIDNDAAEYHNIDVHDTEKEKYINTRIVSSQADKSNVKRFTESQPNDCNRATAEVGLNPRYVNAAKGDEIFQSSDNTETYDYSYSYRRQ